MHRLRHDCPWDARQTHASLVPYLVEESCEVVEAIETGTPDDLREELGDLLLQVVFHSELAAEEGTFDLQDVAAGIAAKLVARHPHVFPAPTDAGDAARATPDRQVAEVPADLLATWEQRKAVEKGRTSALEGIPEQLSALSRGAKILSRARSHRVPLEVGDPAPITDAALGDALLELVARAQASGLDAEQSARAAVRRLEARVRAAEGRGREPEGR